MAKHDVAMAQRGFVLGQFLQAEDDRIGWRLGPGILRCDFTTCQLVTVKRYGADAAVLDGDAKAGGDQCSRTIRHQAHPFFIGALFGPNPKMCHWFNAAASSSMVQLCSILAVLPNMIEAEQYFSAERLMARSTVAGFRLRPRSL